MISQNATRVSARLLAANPAPLRRHEEPRISSQQVQFSITIRDIDAEALLVAMHLRVLAAITSSSSVATVVKRPGFSLLPIALDLEGATWRSVTEELTSWLSEAEAPAYTETMELHPDLLIDNMVDFGDPSEGIEGAALYTRFAIDSTQVDVSVVCDQQIGSTIAQRLQDYYQNSAKLADDYSALVTNGDIRSTKDAALIRGWSSGPAEMPAATLLERFNAQVAARPNAVAVVDLAHELTYAELQRRVNELAGALQANGVRPGDRVGVCVERGTDLVVSLFGVLAAGAAYVPLATESPPARLEFIVRDADLHQVVASPKVFLPPVAVPILQPSDRGPTVNWSPAPNDAAYLMYTSGSTGLPKGVVVEHRNLANFLSAMDQAIGISSQDRVLSITSFSFDISVLELLWPLTRGACVFIAPEGISERLDGPQDSFVSIVRTFCPTLLQGTPSFFAAIGTNPETLQTLDCLQTLLVGGESFPIGLARRLSAALPTVAIFNMYGPTETTIWSTTQRLTQPPATVSIGRPIRNTVVRVVDGLGNDACLGVPGELWIAGEGVARGYFRRAELDAERFVDYQGLRYYRTGDQVYWSSGGALKFLGRNDRQVKIRGHRVELDEIEEVLSEHPQVEAAAVVVDAGRGVITAYVTPRPNEHSSVDRVDYWRQFWGARHTESGTHDGWIDSYTREPFTNPQMHAWYEAIADRIARLRPSRIVDVGSGSGHLLRHLRPGWDHYLGIDFSPPAPDQVATVSNGAVEFRCGSALDLSELSDRSANVVALNSVVQYFPNIGYLYRVLREAMRVAGPDGAVFVGDVRDLRLLHAFHADVQLWRAPPTRLARKILAHANLLARREPELCVAPDLFWSLGGHRVRVECKGEQSWTELSRFRYDVTIFGPKHPLALNDDLPRVRWDGTPLSEIASQCPSVTVADLPNARLTRPLGAVRELNQSSPEATAWDALRAVWIADELNAIDPAAAVALGAANGLRTWVSPAASGELGHIDIHFRKREHHE